MIMQTEENSQHTPMSALTLGALGVVFGDIGTSPLYALKEISVFGNAPFWSVSVYLAQHCFLVMALSHPPFQCYPLLKA